MCVDAINVIDVVNVVLQNAIVHTKLTIAVVHIKVVIAALQAKVINYNSAKKVVSSKVEQMVVDQFPRVPAPYYSAFTIIVTESIRKVLRLTW